MTQRPTYSADRRSCPKTPEPIRSLNDIDEVIRSNQEHRKRHAAESRERAEKNKNRRNALVMAIIAVVVVFCTVGAFIIADNARFAHAMNLPQREVTVHHGDTIDGIAAANPVEGLNAHELGWVIGEINRDSDTMSSPLMPGDRIMIPVED